MFLQGLKKLLNALNGSQHKESVESFVKEGGEFQEVFKILEGGRHNCSQLEVKLMYRSSIRYCIVYCVFVFLFLQANENELNCPASTNSDNVYNTTI